MSKLNQALARYQSALLSTAVGDLIARKSGAVQGPAFELLAARDAVIVAAKDLSAEQFTAALMEFRFLEPRGDDRHPARDEPEFELVRRSY